MYNFTFGSTFIYITNLALNYTFKSYFILMYNFTFGSLFIYFIDLAFNYTFKQVGPTPESNSNFKCILGPKRFWVKKVLGPK